MYSHSIESQEVLHYRPSDGWCGDFIPFFWEGRYHLFYLLRRGREPLSWAHIVSSDLRYWEELPISLSSGEKGEPDAGGCWTGSVIHYEGIFHIFYTGYNNELSTPQTICHATGNDLIHFQKDSANPILSPDIRWYEEQDWRDPFVFWNEEETCWWMLITARVKEGISPRRGCIALATSSDLIHWQVHPPLWNPSLIYAPECPALISLKGKRYLIFSCGETRYRLIEQLKGKWLAPSEDTLDGPCFYAAKTLNDGKREILFGWLATREGEKDTGAWEWGGHLAIPRQILSKEDGLGVIPVEEAVSFFRQVLKKEEEWKEFKAKEGEWKFGKDKLRVSRQDGRAIILYEAPPDYLLKGMLEVEEKTRRFGFLIRTNERIDSGYMISFEPGRQAFALYKWNKWSEPIPELVRPLNIQIHKPLNFQIFIEGSILEVFANEETVLSYRIYDPLYEEMALFLDDGTVSLRDFKMLGK